ncbi:sulfate adenylyltransferase subunit 1 [Agromyces flavus]|uniref:sulfate adenylyltransferase n=1 Tax=Agromyces flavus TaxID=589382 RepID=A0A1H1ZAB1_9MICO|nr:GTP-binding protein [Agromyces flavus]MCP2366975.1 sulfate adenylyltransferase subunit 1 [Agromyces flavus]GGI46650.1 sulfate adenylyltransferase subunit 1 [Agromyces flavus]SDT30126.1 sulfate adenylyltransferase subunit 1 [Agromyces flavus]
MSSLFRFATAGSVDDGKSTLVGRLLHDSKAILADQLESVARTSAERGFGGEPGAIDFALLTDGLRAEREQGITIDVAYRYFSTGRRSFILADCPGHVQYTRNMVTGSATADAVVVLVDVRNGVLEQTRRHLAVVQLLRVPHVIVAVNKIDLIGYDRAAFESVAADVATLARDLGLPDAHVIPVSALAGDNVVERSTNTPWYRGPSLLELLEELSTIDELETDLEALRLPVQLVVRPQGALSPELAADDATADGFRDYRAFAGRIESGTVRVGDRVEVFPSGITTTVAGIDCGPVAVDEASAPLSVSLRLADPVDAARGAVIAAAGSVPKPRREFDADVFQLDGRPLTTGSRVLVKHGTSTVQALVTDIRGRLDLDTLETAPTAALETNDIGLVRLKLAADLAVEPYAAHRRAGAFLVIHPHDGATLAAGIVTEGDSA